MSPGPPIGKAQRRVPQPACSPSPFLKMMPTVPALPASSLLYMIHSGFILESMKVHCSTLLAREWGPQVLLRRPEGWEEPQWGRAWGSPDFLQQGAGIERRLQVGQGLHVGLLAHAHMHHLLGLGLGGLLRAHLHEIIQRL